MAWFTGSLGKRLMGNRIEQSLFRGPVRVMAADTGFTTRLYALMRLEKGRVGQSMAFPAGCAETS